MRYAIETDDLSRRFGRNWAVRDLALRVSKGSFFAFVGPNGAGKTTTIKMLLRLLRPTRGDGRLLDQPIRKLGPEHMGRVGYLAEHPDLPGWMTLDQYLAYLKPFYANWDDELTAHLLRELQLPTDRKIRTLSRGTRLKAALLSRLVYRPELLILDDPFAGVDTLTREQLVDSVLQTGNGMGLTVFVSTHDLDEIEKLVDRIGFVSEGSLLLSEDLASLQQRFRKVELVLDRPLGNVAFDMPPSWSSFQTNGRAVHFTDSEYCADESPRRIEGTLPGVREISAVPMSLRSISLAVQRTATSDRAAADR